jgi:hypothetical protein
MTLNFNSTKGAYCQITKVEQIVAEANPRVITELDYTTNSVWEKTFTVDATLTSTTAYKFRLTETSMGDRSQSYSYWGSLNPKGSLPYDPSRTGAEYYHYVVQSFAPADAFYRFPTTAAGGGPVVGKQAKVSLTFTPGVNEYTHTFAAIQ